MEEENIKVAVVPWKNPEEFIKVYNCAYSNELDKNNWAVEQIAVWQTRCWPSLPTAVEVTLFLLRSKIQDKLYESNKCFYHALDVEVQYANAVIRFLNLLVENDQNGRTKKRLSYLAAERNIPTWIVDIRHNATHGFYPELSKLREAYGTVMEYLEKTFWLPESTRIRCIKKKVDEDPMVQLWQDYKTQMLQVVLEGVVRGKKFMPSVEKILIKMGRYLKKHESRKAFLNVLVRDFVTEEILPLVDIDELFSDLDILSDGMKLPRPLKKFYLPFLHLLHKHDLVSTFIERLLSSQDKRRLLLEQKIVDYFVIYVLDLVEGNRKSETTEDMLPFIYKGVNINKYRLLFCCVKGCSSSHRIVFEKLIKDVELEEWALELTVMMNIKLGKYYDDDAQRFMTPQRKKPKFEMTFNADDLDEDVQEVLEKGGQIEMIKKPWSLASLSIDWATIPIGHVFNPAVASVEEHTQEETVTSPVKSHENLFPPACEESQPIEESPPTTLIFKEKPKFNRVLY